MPLHQSGEDYLEAIYILKKQKGAVRSLDVAEYLGYSKPSVSRAVSILKADGHITVDPVGHLDFTESGHAVAQNIYERHEFLKSWLTELGVPEDIAAADACRMEHCISPETFQCLKQAALKYSGEPAQERRNGL